ncbi:Uncharacterized protein C1orf106-like [Cricetulus griseus]|uniref:Uncharacterized protein C1orf106-like n=1 Tax=Cricetulus griseus TaxID=10029 RepID=G3H3K0_CRIGR|nr:Uncharacterized protein C1orf106-like [Cricetulus griseus]
MESKDEVSDTDSGIILQSGPDSPVSPMKELTNAVRKQQRALEAKLEACLEELRRLCLREAELTGTLPAEYPLKPGEKAPKVRRRIGAAYKLDEWALHREDPLSSLERQFALQLQITEAAHRLCAEENLSRQVRRQRKHAALQEEKKLRELERCLGDRRRNSEPPPTTVPSMGRELSASDDSSLSDGLLLEEEDSKAPKPPPESPAPPSRPLPPQSLEGLQQTGPESGGLERAPIQNSPWKETSLDHPYEKPRKSSELSSESSSPATTPQDQPSTSSLWLLDPASYHVVPIRNVPGQRQGRTSAPATPEMQGRRGQSQSLRVDSFRTGAEGRGRSAFPRRRPTHYTVTVPDSCFTPSKPPLPHPACHSCSEDSGSDVSSISHPTSPGSSSPDISFLRPLCPPEPPRHRGAWGPACGRELATHYPKLLLPAGYFPTGRYVMVAEGHLPPGEWELCRAALNAAYDEEGAPLRYQRLVPSHSRIVRTPSLKDNPAGRGLSKAAVSEELKWWHERARLRSSRPHSLDRQGAFRVRSLPPGRESFGRVSGPRTQFNSHTDRIQSKTTSLTSNYDYLPNASLSGLCQSEKEAYQLIVNFMEPGQLSVTDKLSFLNAVLILSSVVRDQANGNMNNYYSKTLLAKKIETLILEEPIETLDSCVRQQAMLCIVALRFLPHGPSPSPQGTTQALDDMLQALVMEDRSPDMLILQNFVEIILPWLMLSDQVHQQIRALGIISRLLRFVCNFSELLFFRKYLTPEERADVIIVAMEAMTGGDLNNALAATKMLKVILKCPVTEVAKVTRAIYELLLISSQRSEVQTFFASVFVALLFQISFLVTSGSTVTQDELREIEYVDPVSSSVEALKTLLRSSGYMDHMSHIQTLGTWELLVNLETHYDGVALLAKSLVVKKCWHNRPIFSFLIKTLEDPNCVHYFTALVFLTEMRHFHILQPYLLSCCYSCSCELVMKTFLMLQRIVKDLSWHHASSFLTELAFTLAHFFEEESEQLRLIAFEIYGTILAKVSRMTLVFPLRHQILSLLILLVAHLKDVNTDVVEVRSRTLEPGIQFSVDVNAEHATILGWSKFKVAFAKNDAFTILSALLQQERHKVLWFLKQSVALFKSRQDPIRQLAVWFTGQIIRDLDWAEIEEMEEEYLGHNGLHLSLE